MQRQTATIVGIDPGSESLGVSQLTFSIVDGSLISINAITYVGSKMERPEYLIEIHGERLTRIKAHEDNLYYVFLQTLPYMVACESPFINMRRPQAYGALTEVVSAVRNALYRFDPYMQLYMVEPSLVKRAVDAKGNADKDAVRLALSKNEKIMSVLACDLSILDEHSIDAIAVAYAKYLSIVGPV